MILNVESQVLTTIFSKNTTTMKIFQNVKQMHFPLDATNWCNRPHIIF